MKLIAHIRYESAEKPEVQTVAEHCRNTACYAKRCLSDVGLGTAGYLAGLLHDMGKAKWEFTDYIKSGNGTRGSVNHTFAGCRMVLEQFHGEIAHTDEDLTAELIAFAIGSHHGLFDCVDENEASGFLHRMRKADIGYEESRDNFLLCCASMTELQELFSIANAELVKAYDGVQRIAEDAEEFSFYLGMLARLLLSAVIEGDRRDTADFMSGTNEAPRQENISKFWNGYLEHLEGKLKQFKMDTTLQRARGTISARCREFAEKPGGVYRLNVPTGAGKTLSSLRYALAHAKKWGKARLIFTSPLLSILEQNAAVIREYLGDDGIVLEHHSNVVRCSEQEDGLDMRELAAESWNAPVIVTTLVQLLNTLFAGRTTAIRRFQSLCGSVIVIDEVQTVPNRMLTLFNLAVNFLAEVCGATVLLCSATQPCLEQTKHPLRCNGEIIAYDQALWETFRRTHILDAGTMSLEQIALFSRQELAQVNSLLVICNKKDQARFLFQELSGEVDRCYHLSASMCIAHRRETLERLREDLKTGRKCLCVATQVIEAGVDISFQRVIRLTAGMDSMVQAAGRCNRNGEQFKPAPVYIVSCQGEKLTALREIGEGKAAAGALLDAFRHTPEQFGDELSSDKSIQFYYRKLYDRMDDGFRDFTIIQKRNTLFSMLSENGKYHDANSKFAGKYMMKQAFRMAGDLFTVFDENTRDVVVPYGEGAALIAELSGWENEPSPKDLSQWICRAKPYTVAVYDYQLRLLAGSIADHCGILTLNPEYYDKNTGLSTEPGTLDFMEV